MKDDYMGKREGYFINEKRTLQKNKMEILGL